MVHAPRMEPGMNCAVGVNVVDPNPVEPKVTFPVDDAVAFIKIVLSKVSSFWRVTSLSAKKTLPVKVTLTTTGPWKVAEPLAAVLLLPM